jgi:membrane protein YdbS with pleckstrin-like domain
MSFRHDPSRCKRALSGYNKTSVKLDRLLKMLQANWRWLLPVVILSFAVRLLPDRILGSPWVFIVVVNVLLLMLLFIVWRDSRRQ